MQTQWRINLYIKFRQENSSYMVIKKIYHLQVTFSLYYILFFVSPLSSWFVLSNWFGSMYAVQSTLVSASH